MAQRLTITSIIKDYFYPEGITYLKLDFLDGNDNWEYLKIDAGLQARKIFNLPLFFYFFVCPQKYWINKLAHLLRDV